MKEVRSKKGSKQIIIITVMIMLCNFIVPNYAYAADTKDGGKLFKDLAQLLCFVPDVVIDYLQEMFGLSQNIRVTEENYRINYSPGTIFAGQIPAFDINFIKPMEKIESNKVSYGNIYINDITTGEMGDIFNRLKENQIESDGYYTIAHFADSLENEYEKIYDKHNYNESDYAGELSYGVINYDDWYGDYWGAEVTDFILGNQTKSNSFWIYDNTMYFMVFYIMDYMVYFDVAYSIFETTLNDEELQIFEEYENSWSTAPEYKESSAAILQPIIATWYNALRRIALVGLLSVLVYLGIRIVLSSTSAKDKAKYKSMLRDWLVALCLLFTLHYVMNITITVVEKVNEVIGTSVIGQNGEDVLISTIRTDIAKGDSDWGNVIVQTVLYFVLGVYTIIFTIQYLRRVIYLAFLTMIAPLITLTYPLDKIKDKKSQAFDMWLKDYIFFSMLQVIHLLIYYVLVGSSMDLANQGNWLFAIVAIGFLTKAEKIVKKMFGFEKSKTMGALAAGATGALVMNAMNKMKGLGGKKGKAGGDSGSGGGSSNSNVRTATTNPLGAIQGSAGGSGGAGGSSGSGTRTGGSSSSSGGSTKPKRSISGGAKALIGKHYKQVGGTALGLLTGGAGAMIGFAAGVAQGDIGAALTGAAVGGAAGMNLGKGAVNLPGNIASGVKSGWSNLKDTYREGAYGADVAKAIKFDEEFRGGSTYKALQSNPNFSEESVQAMLNAGVTDKKAMTAILDSRMDVNDAIKYHTVAKNCPNEIYYNDNMLRTFWKRTMGIEEKNAERIRDVLGQFK